MTTYINIDERYGENVEATIADYQELNPEGEFRHADTGSLTIVEDRPNGSLVVAIEEKSYLKSLHLYRL